MIAVNSCASDVTNDIMVMTRKKFLDPSRGVLLFFVHHAKTVMSL